MMAMRQLAVLPVLGVAVLAAAGVCAAQSVDLPRTIEVQGQGEMRAAPDELSFSLSVWREGRNPKDARSQMARAARKLLAALSRLGIAEKDVQTAHASIHPQYRRAAGERKVTGYRASTLITVKMRKIEKYDIVLGECLEAGANEFQGVVFSSSRREELARDARRKAMADARARARVLAESGGARMGKLLSVREGSFRVSPPVRVGRGTAVAEQTGATGPSLAGGEVVVAVTVQTAWELKD